MEVVMLNVADVITTSIDEGDVGGNGTGIG